MSSGKLLPVRSLHLRSQLTTYSAGVVGLTSALLLSRDPDNSVTVVAKHMPGDYHIEYTSPWAGANVFPCVSRESYRPAVRRKA